MTERWFHSKARPLDYVPTVLNTSPVGNNGTTVRPSKNLTNAYTVHTSIGGKGRCCTRCDFRDHCMEARKSACERSTLDLKLTRKDTRSSKQGQSVVPKWTLVQHIFSKNFLKKLDKWFVASLDSSVNHNPISWITDQLDTHHHCALRTTVNTPDYSQDMIRATWVHLKPLGNGRFTLNWREGDTIDRARILSCFLFLGSS